MIAWGFAHVADFLWSQGPARDSRLLNWLWPAKLCLGGALQFHHSAVRSCCVCASPCGLINEWARWQTGLSLRMWFGACLHLRIFVCVSRECLSVWVCVRMWEYLSMWTCVCVSVSFSWGLWSRRLPQPGVTFSHEGVAYDTSSGLGQTSPDPSSNTPAWSLPSPVFPFCTPTAAATLPPPLPFSVHWTFSRHPTLLSCSTSPSPSNSWAQLAADRHFCFVWLWLDAVAGWQGTEASFSDQRNLWQKHSAVF